MNSELIDVEISKSRKTCISVRVFFRIRSGELGTTYPASLLASHGSRLTDDRSWNKSHSLNPF